MTRKNVIYIFKTLLAIFILTYVCDKIIYFGFEKIVSKVYTGQGVGKYNQFKLLKDSVNLLVFGDSRANHHVNTVLIDSSSYNMGVDGRGILYFTTLIELLGDNKQSLLIELGPGDAFDSTYDGSDIEPLAVDFHSNEIVKETVIKSPAYNPFQRFFWSIAYNNKVFSILSNYFSPKYDYKRYHGYDPITVSSQQRAIFAKILGEDNRKEVSLCDTSYTPNDIFIFCLKKLKDIEKKHNKRIVIFTAPLYNDKCKEDNDAFASLLTKYGFEYFDYSDLFKQNNSITYWKDMTHLSGSGAEIFTGCLKKDILGK